MLKTYFKSTLRNMGKNKAQTFINMTGLSVGMAVALMIGLWIWDELSFDRYHQHYDQIAQVMQKQTFNGSIATGVAVPIPLDLELRKEYGSDFKHIAMSSWTDAHILSISDKDISYPGVFMDEEGPEIFTLDMLFGKRQGLADPSSILVSHSVAKALFGDLDPTGKMVRLDNNAPFRVTGVYEDLPLNSSLHEVAFMASWNYYAKNRLAPRTMTDWGDNSWQMYVQMADHSDMGTISEKIKNIILKNAGPQDARFKPSIFLQPMRKWRLYSEFKEGVNTGGAIEYVWLFGLIGVFVLLLACINFMNLSTARSEKRAKEVGIRKAIGSLRSQLIGQFYFESLFTAVMSFALCLLLVFILLPFFNAVANKNMAILWSRPLFWLACICFTVFTALVAGSYPALYLSRFNPVKVLKGQFKAGRLSALPRQILVVAQFTISVVLIIGTWVVFNQIQFTKNRPVGYSNSGLIYLESSNDDLMNHFYQLRRDLLKSGAVSEVAESSSPTTAVDNNRSGLQWKGKDPSMTDDFANIRVTTEYGKTVGWKILEGRDFSKALSTDSSALILNEAAVKYMGLTDPVGEIIRFSNKNHTVIGVIKDMVMQSPYSPVKQSIFYLTPEDFGYVILRIRPNISMRDALYQIEAICKTYSPATPFSFKFSDEEYAKKFNEEERIAKLSSFFAALAIFISCLGLFGMASFMAEQRIKEIGIRKVLGATVFNLWGLLSKDFVQLVVIALFIAIPVSYYCMTHWLLRYEYRSTISGSIFIWSALGAVLITLLTVSYQSIRAALMNPTISLKSE